MTGHVLANALSRRLVRDTKKAPVKNPIFCDAPDQANTL